MVCETEQPEGRLQLHTHVARPWGQYTAWEAYSCKYSRYSASAAKVCMASRQAKVMIVGDRCPPRPNTPREAIALAPRAPSLASGPRRYLGKSGSGSGDARQPAAHR